MDTNIQLLLISNFTFTETPSLKAHKMTQNLILNFLKRVMPKIYGC